MCAKICWVQVQEIHRLLLAKDDKIIFQERWRNFGKVVPRNHRWMYCSEPSNPRKRNLVVAWSCGAIELMVLFIILVIRTWRFLNASDFWKGQGHVSSSPLFIQVQMSFWRCSRLASNCYWSRWLHFHVHQLICGHKHYAKFIAVSLTTFHYHSEIS